MLIKKFILSSKTVPSETTKKGSKVYWFQVDNKIGKLEIKKIIERQFKTIVEDVRTLISKKKKAKGRHKLYSSKTSLIKKAIVRLAPGQDLGLSSNSPVINPDPEIN